ncbi:sugar transferase [Pedobacter terrae]|uniref:sugar transferase n=1 Tax=Pedobacter terrae TaxID=405671 RepID=UPI002FFC239E
MVEKLVSNPIEPGIIAMVGFENSTERTFFENCSLEDMQLAYFDNGLKLAQAWAEQDLNIVAIISNSEILSNGGLTLIETLKNIQMPSVPFFLVVKYFNPNLRILALTAGISDVFRLPMQQDRVEKRIIFFIKNWTALTKSLSVRPNVIRPIGLAKRMFDIFFASCALIVLFPLLLIIALSIWLESKGPVFYYSLRAGTGFKVFKFYKFRSMYVDADKKIKDLIHLNQYDIDKKEQKTATPDSVLCQECLSTGKCQYPLYGDGVQWCEKDGGYFATNSGAAFFKIANDPRITKIGNFIRNTSIDELPQLWNVIKGDMSIVGNRPLPIYEAEKLTTDRYVLRFAAPAGITGLWQVEKRGKGEMSEEERLLLDNEYAKNQSFTNDIKLILKTIPALFQKESV